jgi:hypothetical protein
MHSSSHTTTGGAALRRRSVRALRALALGGLLPFGA